MTNPSDQSNVNPNPEAQKKYTDKVMGMISILCGILCLVVSMMPCFAALVAGPGAIGLATGIYGIVRASKDGVSARLSIIGVILNVLGILVTIAIFVVLKGNLKH